MKTTFSYQRQQDFSNQANRTICQRLWKTRDWCVCVCAFVAFSYSSSWHFLERCQASLSYRRRFEHFHSASNETNYCLEMTLFAKSSRNLSKGNSWHPSRLTIDSPSSSWPFTIRHQRLPQSFWAQPPSAAAPPAPLWGVTENVWGSLVSQPGCVQAGAAAVAAKLNGTS